VTNDALQGGSDQRERRGRKPPALPPAGVLRIASVALLLLAAAAFAVPYIAVAHATRRATACLTAYEAPRGPTPPACADEIYWLITPSHLPWTRDAASYRGEELGARIAIADYRDAIIGAPDRARLADAAETLEGAHIIMIQGSRRVMLDDLGPDIGAPNLGRAAASLGDRRTLLDRAELWPDWHVRLRTLSAALIEGDIPRATAIAKRYAEFDPRDEDLRTAVAAMLCLSGDEKRAIELLTSVQSDRATKRYAAMARDWGDVRALLIACAAKAGLQPPPKPESPEAGQGTPMEARALLRIRLAKQEPQDEAGKLELDAASTAALRLLGEASILPSGDVQPSLASELRFPGARAAILAAVLDAGYAIEPARLIVLAQPARDEAPLLPSPAITALDWLRDSPGLGPVVSAQTFERAAERVSSMAEAVDSIETSQKQTPRESSVEPLRAIAGALWMEAAREHARARDAASALRAIDAGAPLARWSPASIALAQSTAWYVVGDVDQALAALDAGPPLDSAAPPASGTAGTAATAGTADSTRPLVIAAALLQRAELLAALRPDRDRGSPAAKAAAAAALLADQAASASGDPALDARARWTRLALVPLNDPNAPPLRPGTETNIDGILRSALVAHAPLAHGGIPVEINGVAVQPGTGANRPWPWVGAIPSHPSSPDVPETPALSTSLSLWSAAIRAPSNDRRALRYMVLRARGDVSPSPLASLSLAADLLADDGDTAIWIDAFTALDPRVLSLRTYTWIRAHAARWRGDKAEASTWLARYATLCALAADPHRAEIARYLGL
jgi:hypothetical protein